MTDPYTPTTEEVRALYWQGKRRGDWGNKTAARDEAQKLGEAEFDRMIEQVRAEVINWYEEQGARKPFDLTQRDARRRFALPVPSTGTESDPTSTEAFLDRARDMAMPGHMALQAVPEPTGDPQRLCPETCTYTPTNGESGLPFPQAHHHCDLPEGHDGNHNGRTGLFGRLGDGKPDAEIRLRPCDRCPTPTESEETKK
jgi:hypothetical protein